MKLRDLFVRIGFKVDQKELEQLDKGLGQLKKSILAIGAAGIATSLALFKLTKGVADIGDNARKTAMALGLTTESLQELEFAFSIGGVKGNEFTVAIRRVAKTISDTSFGLETYKRIYDELGISVITATGGLKSTDQILVEVADKFAKMEDGTKKTAFAVDLFGRSGAKMIPMLNEGAAGIDKLRREAHDLGFVMSDELGKKSEELIDAITRFWAILRGLRIEAAKHLIPAFTEIVDDVRKWIAENRKFLNQKINQYIKLTVKYLKELYLGIRKLLDVFGGLGNLIKVAAIALAIFVGANMLMGLGNVAMAVGKIALAYKFLGKAAIIAQLKMLAMALLVGIGIAALIIILQDIKGYFEGKDSVTGLILEAFEKKFPAAFERTIAGLKTVKQTFIDLGKLIASVAAMIAGLATLDWELIKVGAAEFGKIFAPAAGMTGIPALTRGAGAIYNQAKANVNANITINVPAGTPVEEVGGQIKEAIKEVISDTMLEANLATEPRQY